MYVHLSKKNDLAQSPYLFNCLQTTKMPLKGLKVLEFVGLAPAPFCGKILADFGASVTRIDKIPDNSLDVLQHGKKTLALNLKNAKAQQLLSKLSTKYDVLIDPFRAGVLEKLNLGPERLCKQQPRLIYARLTGFGQTGRLAKRAGHDINYAAISGVLSMLGRHGERPLPPINILADFAGGGLMCALGICLALLERHHSGCGQVVDAAMCDGASYVASWLFMSRSLPFWNEKRGLNILDGGAFYYDIYETKDGRYMSVGALEPQFFEIFKNKLGLPHLLQYFTNKDDQQKAKETVRTAFLQKSQAEWSSIFEDVDACVYPVLEWQEAMQHDHNRVRESFKSIDGVITPAPAPRLSRTPGVCENNSSATNMEETLSIITELGLDKGELRTLIDEGVILMPSSNGKL